MLLPDPRHAVRGRLPSPTSRSTCQAPPPTFSCCACRQSEWSHGGHGAACWPGTCPLQLLTVYCGWRGRIVVAEEEVAAPMLRGRWQSEWGGRHPGVPGTYVAVEPTQEQLNSVNFEKDQSDRYTGILVDWSDILPLHIEANFFLLFSNRSRTETLNWFCMRMWVTHKLCTFLPPVINPFSPAKKF